MVVVMGSCLFASLAKRVVEELGKMKKVMAITVLLASQKNDNEHIFILVPHLRRRDAAIAIYMPVNVFFPS